MLQTSKTWGLLTSDNFMELLRLRHIMDMRKVQNSNLKGLTDACNFGVSPLPVVDLQK